MRSPRSQRKTKRADVVGGCYVWFGGVLADSERQKEAQPRGLGQCGSGGMGRGEWLQEGVKSSRMSESIRETETQ